MKTVSTDLFTLIKSLSPSEKKIFRQQTDLLNKGEKPLYLLLFDAVEKQEIYDEEKVLKKLSGKLSASNISYQKNYLTEILLDFLATKANDAEPESTWLILIRKAQIFSRRNMPEAALRMAEKAQVFAEKNQMLFEVVYAQNMKWQLQLAQWNAVKQTETDDAGNALQTQIQHLQTDTYLNRMYYRVLHATSAVPLAMSHEEFHRIAKELLADKTLQDSTAAHMPFQLQYKAAVIHSAIYSKLKDTETAFQWKERELELLESQPTSLLHQNGEYLFALINFCHRCRFAGKTDVFLKYIKKLENLNPPTALEAEKTFGLLREWSGYYFQQNDFEKAAALEKNIHEALQQFPEYNDRFTIETLHLNVAASFFHSKKFDDALRNTAAITNSPNPGKTFTLHLAAKLLNCMIYFEQKEAQLLDYQLSQLYRELLKYDHNDERLQKVVSHFKKLNPTLPASDLKKLLQAFSEEVSQSEYDNFLVRWFSLREWISEQLKMLR